MYYPTNSVTKRLDGNNKLIIIFSPTVDLNQLIILDLLNSLLKNLLVLILTISDLVSNNLSRRVFFRCCVIHILIELKIELSPVFKEIFCQKLSFDNFPKSFCFVVGLRSKGSGVKM